MIWILGAEGVFAAFFGITEWTIFDWLSGQFKHSEWHGFTFYDLIFPLFIFLSGVTLGIANKSLMGKPLNEKKMLYKYSFKRLSILCFLGVVYNHGWGQGIPPDLDKIRYASVLMRIGFSWFFCAMIVWHFKPHIQRLIALGLLLGYWVLQQFITTPDGYVGQLNIEHSWNAWVDQMLLPGIIYRDLPVDPEGLLSQLPAIVNALAGAFAGRLLSSKQFTNHIKFMKLLFAGFICILLGYLWSFVLPFNKILWTSSFALLCIGYSCVLLAIFYWLFDVIKLRKTGVFFAVIGANSILLYLLTSLFNWQYFINSLFSQFLLSLGSEYQLFFSIILLVAVQWILAKLLYDRKLFLRI